MSYYLGWGSPASAGGVPNDWPFAKDNDGSAIIWQSQVAFGLDPAFDLPGYGVPVDYTVVYSPADGGDAVTTVLDGQSAEYYGYLLYAGWPPEVKAGVHEITASVAGTPCLNKLVITIVETTMYYGTAAWYAEDISTPPSVNKWERRILADEA